MLVPYLATALSLAPYGNTMAQNAINHNLYGEIIKCHTVENEEIRRMTNAELPSEQEFEQWMEEKISTLPAESKSGTEVVTLPVIFHVVHAGEPLNEGLNVSSDLIYAQIEQLNHDFRRMNETSGYNDHPDGADLMIEFCPALVSPDGQMLEEPGINRINGSTRTWGKSAYSASYFEYFVKPETIWDADNYLNIWVSPTTSYFFNVLGYAQFPTISGLDGLDGQPDDPDTDGVVVSPYTIGSTELPNPQAIGNLGMGRTLTHEMGHFFGLRHIWGDGDCGVDDYCADTPNAEAANEGCPGERWSCGSLDMVENFMDYTDDPCKKIFTQDQKIRVWTVLANSPRRSSLAMSKVCQDPPPCTAPTTPPENPTATVTGAGALLTWSGQNLTKGCQVNIGFVSGSVIKSLVVAGHEVNQVLIPANKLSPNKNYRWRVRCGCSRNPVVAGPWTPWQQFYVPGGSAMQSSGGPLAGVVEDRVELAPNPASEYVNVSMDGEYEASEITFELFDAAGRKVWSGIFPYNASGRYRLDLPGRLSGVYFMQIVFADQIRSEKLLIR